jgi:hypothetical protein
MADSDPTGNSNQNSDSNDNLTPSEWRNKMKATSERANAAEAKVMLYERDLTFREAGLDPQDPRVKYFVKGYDGELNADSIRQEATAAGFINQNSPEPTFNENISDALEAEQRIVNAGQGGDPVPVVDLNDQMRALDNTDDLKELWERNGRHWNAAQ